MQAPQNTDSARRWAQRCSLLWKLAFYFLLTKPLEYLVILPLGRKLLQMLLGSSGLPALSSGNIQSFIFSLQALGLLLLGLVLLVLSVALDISAMVLLAEAYYRGTRLPAAPQLLLQALRSMRRYASPQGLLICLFLGLIVPLLGLGLAPSLTSELAIPAFIREFIADQFVFYTLYSLVNLLLFVVLLFHIFTVHELLLAGRPVVQALRGSRLLVRRRPGPFLRQLVLGTALQVSAIVLLVLGLSLGVFFLYGALAGQRFWRLFLLLSYAGLIFVLVPSFLPYMVFRLSRFYYSYRSDSPALDKERRWRLPATAVSIVPRQPRWYTQISCCFLLLGALLGLAAVLDLGFDDFFVQRPPVCIVGHRGAGESAPENSLESLALLRERGVQATEVDIQRSRDGHYFLYHDDNLGRLHGSRQRVVELSAAEAENYGLCRLEDFLASAGEIHLYLELKGSSADQRMVDEVLALIKAQEARGGKLHYSLISLDYKLIQYIEARYPEVETGYLYFFALGSPEQLEGDLLMIELGLLTDDFLERAKEAGKSVLVWTVNQPRDMRRVVRRELRGVITDRIDLLEESIRERDAADELELILNELLY